MSEDNMVIADSARVSSSTITSQPYANIFNLINNRSNVPDPNDGTGNRKFVHVRIPHVGRNFFGFPFIVLQRVQPTKERNLIALTKSFMSYDFDLTVFCKDDEGDGSGNPVGAAQCEEISNSIIKTLNDSSNRKTLINQAMAHLRFNMEINDDEDIEGNTVFTSTFTISFENTLLSVS